MLSVPVYNVCVVFQWAEAQKQCKRLKLQDLIISPMQRLTKYKLLLKAILKKTENNEHRNDLISMVSKEREENEHHSDFIAMANAENRIMNISDTSSRLVD